MAKLKRNDPAYWMLAKGKEKRRIRNLVRGEEDLDKNEPHNIYKEGCYICEDEEYALMGLPLCYPCNQCGGHVAADDCVCDDCGEDQQT